jgi:hypothetical protein
MRKPLPEPAGKDNTLFKLPYEVVKREFLKTAPELMVISWLPTALQGMDRSFEKGGSYQGYDQGWLPVHSERTDG